MELVNKGLFPWRADILLRVSDRSTQIYTVSQLLKGDTAKQGMYEIGIMGEVIFLDERKVSLSKHICTKAFWVISVG